MSRAMKKWLVIFILLILAVVIGTRGSTLRWLTGQAALPATSTPSDRPPAPRATKRNDRSEVLSVEEFCTRLAVAKKKGTEDAVRRAIVKAASGLNSDRLVKMIAEVETSSCGAAASGSHLEVILVDALYLEHPALAADYAVDAFSKNPSVWDFFCGVGLFDGWAGKDVASLIAWSDQHRHLFPSDKSSIMISSEKAILQRLLKAEPEKAMSRVHGLPKELAFGAVGRLFRERSDLLEPDQAIDFLRDALNRENHEDLVGETCGTQLYRLGRDKMKAFFLAHDATLKEREAILYQAVTMEVNMGFKGTPREYIDEVRAFANEEGPGITGKLTALILGTIADRDHDDKAAVDRLLGFDPDDAALRVFLKARGASLDAKQRERITASLGSDP